MPLYRKPIIILLSNFAGSLAQKRDHFFPLIGRRQNWNVFKIIWFLHHLKALNERISEWAYFLNWTRRFQRYLNLSAFFRQDLKQGTYISEMALKNNICDVFFNFLEINIHNFVKNDPKFQNKGLFHAKFYGAWHENKLDPIALILGVWVLKTSLYQFGSKRFIKT